MSSENTIPKADLSALRRHFEISLYLLLLTSVLALVSTGKLDLVSILVPPTALLLKGYRWWRGLGPELSNGPITISNSYLRNATDVLVTTIGSVNGADGLPAKSMILQNDTFAAEAGQPLVAIDMVYETSGLGTAAA